MRALWSRVAGWWSGESAPRPGDDAGLSRVRYFADKYFPTGRPLGRVLTLGCGGGKFERRLARYNFARTRSADAG